MQFIFPTCKTMDNENLYLSGEIQSSLRPQVSADYQGWVTEVWG